MKVARIHGFLLLALMMVAAKPLHALETLDWESLVPPVDESLDPFTWLPKEQQDSLYDLWMLRERFEPENLDQELQSLKQRAIENLAAGGYDADKILAELDRYIAVTRDNNFKLVEDLDGLDVRIPGYVLPTEFSGSRVVEFLLVPYVGACVHTPPPPANQLVLVNYENGFVSEGLFAPVWVTGKINTARSTQSIDFTDGAMEVESGYRLEASGVLPYE